MIIDWSARARRRANVVDTWWRANTSRPNLFVEELLATLELLLASPRIGKPYPSKRARNVRCVLMRQTQQRLYYSLNSAKGIIKIVTIWGTARRRGPKL